MTWDDVLMEPDGRCAEAAGMSRGGKRMSRRRRGGVDVPELNDRASEGLGRVGFARNVIKKKVERDEGERQEVSCD